MIIKGKALPTLLDKSLENGTWELLYALYSQESGLLTRNN